MRECKAKKKRFLETVCGLYAGEHQPEPPVVPPQVPLQASSQNPGEQYHSNVQQQEDYLFSVFFLYYKR